MLSIRVWNEPIIVQLVSELPVFLDLIEQSFETLFGLSVCMRFLNLFLSPHVKAKKKEELDRQGLFSFLPLANGTYLLLLAYGSRSGHLVLARELVL